MRTGCARHYTRTMMRLDVMWKRVATPKPQVLDGVLAFILLALIVATSNEEVWLGALLATAPLIWRRRYPVPVFFVVVFGVVIVASDSSDETAYFALSAAMIAAYSVGAYCRRRLVSLGLIVGTATAIVTVFNGGMPHIPDYAGPFLVLVPLWLVGNAIRTRQLRADAFEDKATRLEREQERAKQAALAEERARIARELHDVVAHSVSVMVVQAGAARQVLKASPEQATESLLAVEATGREAMTELRNLLGLLSDDGEDISLAPQPGIDELEPLIQRVRDAGLPVELRVIGESQPLPSGVDLTAYRIVQEALTNALKYSGLARTEIILDYRDTELKVEVLDEGSAESARAGGRAGRGLVGMRERAALYGGTLEAGPRLERGYAVRAWLPF